MLIEYRISSKNRPAIRDIRDLVLGATFIHKCYLWLDGRGGLRHWGGGLRGRGGTGSKAVVLPVSQNLRSVMYHLRLGTEASGDLDVQLMGKMPSCQELVVIVMSAGAVKTKVGSSLLLFKKGVKVRLRSDGVRVPVSPSGLALDFLIVHETWTLGACQRILIYLGPDVLEYFGETLGEYSLTLSPVVEKRKKKEVVVGSLVGTPAASEAGGVDSAAQVSCRRVLVETGCL